MLENNVNTKQKLQKVEKLKIKKEKKREFNSRVKIQITILKYFPTRFECSF